MNKRTEQTRWTPKRLLSLLMALIMTLSLLPTAVFADDKPSEWNLDNFTTTGNEPESQVIVASDFFSANARYELRINIDPNKTYMPGDRVSVKAIAQLINVDSVNQPLKIAISEQTFTANNTNSTLTVSYPFVGDSAIIVGKDGSISFNAGITYNVTVDGTTFADTKNVTVKINNLWPGYNVTYTKPEDANFTGSIAAKDGKYHTYASTDQHGNIIQTYKVPMDAGAEQDGYTFEGWYMVLPGSAGTLKRVIDPYPDYEYDCKSVTGDITLDAVLKKNQIITFDEGDYSGASGIPNKAQYSQGTRYTITVQDPKLAGYKFTGWKITSDVAGDADADNKAVIFDKEVHKINGPITLSAQWTPADGSAPAGSHKVTFLAGAADAYIPFPTPATVEDGANYTIPATPPTREGYTFAGWSDEQGNTYPAGKEITNVTTDIVLSAMWQQEMVTVTFPAATGTVGSTDVLPAGVSYHTAFGTKPTTGPVAKGSDVTFRLFLDDLSLDPATLHVFANGLELLGTSINSYNNCYEYTVHNVTVDTKITVYPPTAKTFTVMMPVGHFTAQIKAVDSIGSTKAEDGISASIVHGGSYTFTVTPDEGYTVKRVAVNGATINATNGSYTVSKVTTAQTVEVVVDELPVYIVIYNSNNSQYAFQRVTAGSKAALPAAPVVEGYTFGGWYTKQNGEGEQFTDATAITGDITVYAKLTANTYQINYNQNTTDTVTNMPTVKQDKTHGKAVKLSETVPTRVGYTFLGWGTTASATAASYQPGDMYSVDGTITLYAVWQQNTYTITLPSGTGYSIETSQSKTVEHGKNFTFTVKVDRAYAANEPVVKVNSATDALTPNTPATNSDGSVSYTYTIENIMENKVVSVQVKQNLVYTVTFMTGTSVYQTQQVGYNEKATKPADPVVDGYTFGGWYRDAGCTNAWNFVDVTDADGNVTAANTVTDNTTIYAKLTPITPAITWTAPITADGYTIEVKGTKAGETTESTLNSGDKVAYGSKVTFTITVADGYDASKMQVGVNGILYAPNEKNGNVYTYEFIAKEDTKITVTGIERKTVTVIYNANARDDVSGLPSPQVVKYYLAALGETGNDKITTQVPSRTGYTFLGWNTNSEAKEADARYTAEKIRAGAASEFTQDTTLYAIWKAQDTELTLKITDVAYDTQENNRVIQYEGESITLQAELNHFAVGSVTFYKSSTKEANKTNSTIVGSTSIEGTTATFRTTVGEYKTTAKDEYYWAEFTPNADEGYSGSTSGVMNVGIFSKALSWKITKGTSNVADNGNVLNVYEGDSATGTPITGNMVAGHTYTLQVKTGSITGVETLDSKQPVLGKDYKIVWQYTEVGKNDWKTDGEASDKATYLVTGDKSGYQFRAQIVPLGPDNGSLFVKAGKFENDALVNDQYDTCLYTKSTNTTVRQSTATTLTIDAPEESKDIKINGDTPFTAIGEHKAQFEGQAVTLTATVTDTTTGTPTVTTGFVDFYRKGATAATKLNASPIAVGANGVATYEVEISKWTDGESVTDNKDEFYAVYLANATYDTSASWTATTGKLEAVYIKSAKLMTPVIDSTLAGTLNGTVANSTSYEHDLNGLLAGVQHTFKLRQDADQTTKDYSVVALDGRTVDTGNYDIEWQYKTNGNFAKVDNDSTAVTYTTKTTKFGDQYRVVLNAKGDMTVGATSKVAEIGKKQDVTVTVKATDAITKTPVDRENGKYPDVYQLNEITLTATVAAAKGADATMKPTGTVTFYYSVDGTNWTKIGEAKDLAEVAGVMTASIKTDQLPVKANDNTKQDVKITAVYSGDATFNASATVNETEKSITAAAGCTTTNDTVTVYSSVVFNCNDENKKQPTDGDKGIHISVSDGAFKTNEKATLALSDIYTLDRELTDETLRNTIAKLNPTTDYIVQWQKLDGATSITSGDYGAAKNWTNIDGKTGTTLVLDKVEQNTAYRAVITVNDQPITKGSYKEVDQPIKGRQVYYSNVLMPTDTSMTVSVALNTSKIGAENTEGITEGETVTANVYLSGVVGAVPNANVTVKVTNDDAKGNGTAGEYKQILGNKNTVNGWNAFDWDTTGVTPGFYTLTVSATTNTGYAAKEITRSLIVRESSYNIEVGNTNPTYNGHTQGLTVTLDGFDFKGTGINEAANKSWTVRYEDANGNPVEPTQAGTYKAKITLPASAYWTEQTKTVDFTIEKRSVSIADAIAQAKVYDGTTDVNIVEVILNDAETNQAVNGTGLPTNNVGIINGDSIYAVATEAKLSSANAGDNSFTISTIDLRGDDAANYVWNDAVYTEPIYVSRSQVYGVSSTDVTLKAGEKLPADAVYMIDQAGNKITSYDVLYYLHTDTEIKKVDNTNEKGLYTVIVRPKQDNYKSGVTLKVTVGDTTSYTPAVAPKPSTLITISNTAELYGAATGVTASTTNDAATTTIEYQSGSTGWTATAPTDAGRYLVKVTASTGDVAYGIYTITKAHPSIDFNAATDLTYNSMPQDGYSGTPTVPTSAESYITYAGDVAIGYNTPADGNVDEQAPVDAGTYTVTLHVNETANYTAHEISKSFTIAKKALTIKADSWQTTQYDAFPDMTAGYTGLAAETGDTTPDTSLRDVQIAPEFLYNPTGGKSNYSNDSLDQVGYVAIQPIDALSKNYAITYEKGQYTKQRTETNVDLDIHGLPQSSTGKNTVYYGDEIQLYPYGYYTTHANGSGIFDWSVTTAADFKGTVTIGKETGLLNVNGVGEFTVTLKRGVGEQQIKTEINVTAIQKEAKIALKNVDKVYTGASQTYDYTGNVTVHDELYQPIDKFVDSKLTRTNTARTNVGTQITTAQVTGALAYQSEIYGGKFTINDKEASVAPVADAHIYGTTRTIPSPAYTSTDSNAISNVLTASQTDAYNRLDVHDGYEILVAGTENMNYNVKYTTDETAEDSAVTTYDGMKLYSTTTKAKNELNDATVYGEQANDLDWILDAVKSTTRDSETYADNLADFDLADTTGIFIKQDKDDCVGNAKTYKAANREEGNTSSTALAADRTATEKAADDNYELVFSSVTNAKAKNYRLDNNDVKNEKSTMTAPTGTVGFIGAPATSDNLIEGSANIAQRPIKLEKAVDDVQLYWKLSQKQLYTALVNVLKAEENSVGRGLAKGHTIEDLDLSFTIGSTPVDKNDDQPMHFTDTGKKTVTVTVGDTNYKLEGSNTFEVDFQTMRIRATYYNKTFTGFDVRIEKIDAAGNSVGPLDSTKGLTFKVLKQTNGVLDTETDYAANKSFTFVSKDGTYGYFHGSYSQLPLLGNGELYVFQMYEYGVPLERK